MDTIIKSPFLQDHSLKGPTICKVNAKKLFIITTLCSHSVLVTYTFYMYDKIILSRSCIYLNKIENPWN